MNERIRQLAEQAGLKVESWMTNPPKPFQILGSTEQFEKFAELIVAECIQVGEAHAKDLESQPTDPLLEAYDDGIVNGIYEATEAIKEHFFGVEE